MQAGETFLIHQNDEPIAAIIPYADFLALQDQLEDLSDQRAAEAALAEYLRDPSSAISVEEMMAQWAAEDIEVENYSSEA